MSNDTVYVTKPKKIEKPRMKRFRDEFRSTNWTLDMPTAATMENITQKMPPIMGSGIVTKNVPNLEKRPKMIIINPPT